MEGDLLIMLALISAGIVFLGILTASSIRLFKLFSSIPKTEKQPNRNIMVVSKSAPITNVKPIDFD